MMEKLLLELANGGIEINDFIKWLSSLRGGNLFTALDYKCTRTDFVTYFLNFIHEDLLGNNDQILQEKSICSHIDTKRNYIYDRKRTGLERCYPSDLTSCSLDVSSNGQHLDGSTQELNSSITFKIYSEPNLDLTSTPLSSFHSRPADITTTKNNSNMIQKSSEKISPLCLSDFLVNTPVIKKGSKKMHSANDSIRKITPTSIKNEKVSIIIKSPNCFSDLDAQEIVVDKFNGHYNILVDQSCRNLGKHHSNENNLQFISRKLKFHSPSPKENTDATMSSISNEIALNNLVKIYVAILNNCFVLNITSEIYFLVMLLTKKQASSVSIFFNSIHNMTYFVVKSLESQIDILMNFDKSTLMMLSNNQHLKCFSKLFSEQLWKLSEKKNERLFEFTDNLQNNNVYFNLDTDNRENFPTDSSFHSFRKQRDLFYEIFRIWEVNHVQHGWIFAVALAGKIRSLFNIVDEPTNFLHLGRLFKDQLLKTCGKYHKDDDFSFLSSLPNIDADKLNRLKNRLITKQSLSSLNAVPAFMGYEEFFKDFILTASNYSFNKHLSDAFISEIIEINDTKFCVNDYDDSDIDVATKKTFLTCLKYLKVLAKFLGFLESLPYRSVFNTYSENLLLTHVTVRKQITPSLDIKQIITRSIEQRYVILTIPWVTEYLAMLDFLSLRLPYYISVYKILFNLYRTYYQYERCYFYNVSLVRLSLGWLFELPHFPDMEFFAHLNETESFQNSSENKEREKKALDDLQIVDENLLYTFCPYLEEIKKVLLTDAVNSQATVKHITPVTAIQYGQEIAKKKIEIQLEEAFFYAQPVSVRKTVDFVSERIASTCVKYICHDIVPEFKQRSYLELENIMNMLGENGDNTKGLKTRISAMAQSYLTNLREACNKATSNIIKEKVPSCAESLLPVDTLKQTKTTCITITAKMCKDRVKQWIDSHINITIFTKDLNLEFKKMRRGERSITSKPLFSLPSMGNKSNHTDNCLSAAQLLEVLKCLSIDLLEENSCITEDSLLHILNKTYVTLTERCDVNNSINSYICTTLVDFAILLVVNRPDIAQKEIVLRHFVRVWNEFYGKTEDLFKNIICYRNIMLMAQPCNDRAVWINMARFLAFLIKTEVITCDDFEFQCTAFYQKTWNVAVLQNMSTFLNKFLECYKKNNGSIDKFTYLLEFLSDFCVDL